MQRMRLLTPLALTFGALFGCLGGSLVGTPSSAAAGAAPAMLPGGTAPVPPGDTVIGPANTTTTLSLTVTLEPRDPTALAAAAQAVSTPGSPTYRQFLAPGQFAQLYGPTSATISAVTSALRALGLTVGSPTGPELSLPVKATVAQAESAFSTPILAYRLPSGNNGYYNTAAPSVPASVASDIEGVIGLDTLNQPHSGSVPSRAGNPGSPARPLTAGATAPGQPTPTGSTCTSEIEGVQSSYGAWDADDLAQAYSFGSVYTGGHYGAGATVAIVELTGAGYSSSDISTFAGCYGITLGANQIKEEFVDGSTGATNGDNSESELDIETVLAMAPKANIEVYEGENSLYDIFRQMVSDDTAKIISSSWSACEKYFGPSYEQEESSLFQAAAMQGQTVFADSADNGSQGCNQNDEVYASTGTSPSAQAVDPTTGTLYVANSASDSVSVIGETGFISAGTITTDTDPSAVVLDAAASKLIVANASSNSLTEVSTTNCNATTTSGCGTTTDIPSSTSLSFPDAMALDGSTLYIANADSGTVAVFNVTTGKFTGSVTLPLGAANQANPKAIKVDSSHTVYVADNYNSAVDYFNGATCSATTQTGCATAPSVITVGPEPTDMTIDASVNDLYVADGGGGVSVVSTTTHAVTTTIATNSAVLFDGFGNPDSIGMSPDGKEVLFTAATGIGDVMATIVPGSQTVSGTVGFNTGSNFLGQLVSDPNLDLVWVTDEQNDTDAVEDLNLAVNDPASQPFVTGVGGTTLTALGPAPTESAWNDNNHYALDATGGGISQDFAMPSYQQALGVVSGSSGSPCGRGTTPCREVPDVSGNADPYTGYVIYDSLSDGGWTAYGGTSASTPLWAAILADISSADGTTAAGYGSLNPALYSLAGSSPGKYFNDVTTGNNDYNGTSGGVYPAMTGYDMTTGIGTPIVSALATGLAPSGGGVPTVSGVSPNTGPASGGTNITITGTGFVAGATVTIGQGSGAVTGAIAATNVKVVSPTQITATTGGGAKTGTFSLFVTTSGGTSAGNSVDYFDYTSAPVVPTVSGVSPNSGPTSGGTNITVTGTGFITGATVTIGQGNGAVTGAIAATNVKVVSSTQITATTGGGAKAGTWSLFVTTSGGTSAGNSVDYFAYGAAPVVPTVAGVSPNSGPTTGGTNITVTGSGFIAGATVTIGQGSGAVTGAIVATNVKVVSSTQITAATGGGAKAGTWSLFVTTSGGTSAGNSVDYFAYGAAPVVPTVAGLAPTTGPTTGGTTITITGTGFIAGATVTIGQGSGAVTGAIKATNVKVVSSTQITATTGGGGKAGTWSLFVTTSGGTSAANSSDNFTYH
jgi:subtilase family serine protease